MRIIPRYHLDKVWLIGDQAVVSGASFVTNMLVARTLGVTGFGKYSLVVLLTLFLLSLQQAGSTGIYQVTYQQLTETDRRKYTSGIIYQHLGLYMLLLAGCLGLAYCFQGFPGDYRGLVLPVALGAVFFLLQDLLRKILLTQLHTFRAFVIDAITNISQVVLLAVFAFYQRLTLSTALWIICITFLPSVITGIFWIKPGACSFHSIRVVMERHKKQSGWMLLSAILQWFAGNFFVLASGWWLGVAALGALRLAQYIFGLLNVILQALENYAAPAASRFADNENGLAGFLRQLLLKSMLIFVPALLLIAIFSRQLLTLAGGHGYQEYAYVMYGLALNYFFIVAALPVRLAMRVSRLNQQYFFGYVLATAFSLLSARWLITSFNLSGVLCGLFFTQIIIITYWLFILFRKRMFTWKLFTSY